MPTYKRFEDLPVWKSAIDLGLKVFTLTEDRAFAHHGDLRSQLRRAALSVSNNIAEGLKRGTTIELPSFLYIARGSAGEMRSMLLFAERMGRISRASNAADLKSEIPRRILLQATARLGGCTPELHHQRPASSQQRFARCLRQAPAYG